MSKKPDGVILTQEEWERWEQNQEEVRRILNKKLAQPRSNGLYECILRHSNFIVECRWDCASQQFYITKNNEEAYVSFWRSGPGNEWIKLEKL